VCVCERENWRGWETKRKISVVGGKCACVCVCVRERESESERE